RLFSVGNRSAYVKDAFHEYVIHGNKAAVNPGQMGTKMAAYYLLQLAPGQSATLKLRLTDIEPLSGMDLNSAMVGIITSPGHAERAEGVPATNDFEAGFDGLFATRQKEAEEFYAVRIPEDLSEDAKAVMRQSFSGMLCPSSFITTMFELGSKAILLPPRHPQSAGTAATRIGRIFTTKTFCPCQINGNIRGTQRGTSRFTAFPWRSSIPILPRISSSSFCA